MSTPPIWDVAAQSAPAVIVSISLPGTPERSYRRCPLPATIGRSATNTICLNHPLISRHHAQVDVIDDCLTIRDLSSRNGTRVDGTAVRDANHPLPPGATVLIGPYVLSFGRGDPEEDTTEEEPRMRLSLDRALHALCDRELVVLDRLSRLEFSLLDQLELARPAVVHHELLGNTLWGPGQWDAAMLHALVHRLRRKLDAAGLDGESVLRTVAGAGYRFG